MAFYVKVICICFVLQGTALFADECRVKYNLTIEPNDECQRKNGRQFICKFCGPQISNTTMNITAEILYRSPDSQPCVLKQIANKGKSIHVTSNTCLKSNGDCFCRIKRGHGQKIWQCLFSKCDGKEQHCKQKGCVHPVNGTGDQVCTKRKLDDTFPCPANKPNDKKGSDLSVTGSVLGVVIVLLLLASVIVVFKLIKMFKGHRRLEYPLQRRESTNMEQTTHTYRTPLPFPNESECINGHAYAQLEPGSGYNDCRTGAHCDTEQHIYEDTDIYLKHPEDEGYTNPDDNISSDSGKGTNTDYNISPHSEDEDYANPNDDISGKNEPQLHSNVQVEVTDGSPETEEPAYAVLEQEIPDPEQGISDPEQGIPDPEQETPDPEQGISDPELVPDNSGHSTMHV